MAPIDAVMTAAPVGAICGWTYPQTRSTVFRSFVRSRRPLLGQWKGHRTTRLSRSRVHPWFPRRPERLARQDSRRRTRSRTPAAPSRAMRRRTCRGLCSPAKMSLYLSRQASDSCDIAYPLHQRWPRRDGIASRSSAARARRRHSRIKCRYVAIGILPARWPERNVIRAVVPPAKRQQGAIGTNRVAQRVHDRVDTADHPPECRQPHVNHQGVALDHTKFGKTVRDLRTGQRYELGIVKQVCGWVRHAPILMRWAVSGTRRPISTKPSRAIRRTA